MGGWAITRYSSLDVKCFSGTAVVGYIGDTSYHSDHSDARDTTVHRGEDCIHEESGEVPQRAGINRTVEQQPMRVSQ